MVKSVLSASVIAILAGQVSAAPLKVEEIFGSFGAVTEDYSGNSESEGRVIIAGDATGNIIINDRNEGTAADGFDDLIIIGDATDANITVGKSGGVTIEGDLTDSNLQLNGGVQTVTLGGLRTGGTFNQNEDILIENAAPANIPEIDFSVFEAESERLSQLPGANSVSTNASGQRVFGGAPVLNIDFSFLTAGTGVYDLTGLDTLLINVAGDFGDVSLNFVDHLGIAPIDAATGVIWNFFEATGVINFNTTVFGHVLAPGATIELGASNEGSVIAQSILSDDGELHPLEFTGNIPPSDDPAPVPLPAGGLLLLSGFAAMIAARRSRKAVV